MKSLSFGGCYKKTKREGKKYYFYEAKRASNGMDRLYLKQRVHERRNFIGESQSKQTNES